MCPTAGWRSAIGEAGVFPTGKLSHSYESYFGDDINTDVAFEDFMQTTAAVDVSTLSGVDQLQGTLTNYYKFAFDTNSTTLCDLTNPLALCVLFGLLLLVRTFKKIFMPKFSSLGRRLGRAAHGPEWEADNQDRIVKFGEYVYRLIFHSSVSIYGAWYFYDKPWWNKATGGTKNLWEMHPNHPVEPGMAWYYLVQCAYHLDSMISILSLSFTFERVNPLAYSSAITFTQEKIRINKVQSSGCSSILWTPLFHIKWAPTIRGDFREMIVHHIITDMLIIGSSHFRFTRIGSMILLVHDLSELPVEMSKLANFVKWKITSAVCFTIMLVMWVVNRLHIFPCMIFKSVLTESYEYLVVQGTMDPALYQVNVIPFVFLLGGLILLHIVWFFMMLRIGWTLIKKGEAHDYTEYKQGENQTVKKEK